MYSSAQSTSNSFVHLLIQQKLFEQLQYAKHWKTGEE